MGSPFVVPEVVRLPLSAAGNWIDVKRKLNVAETRAMLRRANVGDLSSGPSGEVTTKVNLIDFAVARAEAYLVAWSFVDASGRPVAVSPDAIGALDPDMMREIGEALEAHIGAAAEEKKVSTGADAPDPTSPSAS